MKVQENEMLNKMQEDDQVARVAARLLNENAQHLNAVTLRRLSDARGMAVNKLTAIQGVNQSGNLLQMIGHGFGSYIEHHRMLSAVIIVIAMMLTFYATQRLSADNSLENSDAFLLASELPPEAFADKGFDTWLVSKRD
jgi:uncharacterized membrane protein